MTEFKILESSETLSGKIALTMAWPDGRETVEVVSQGVSDILKRLDDTRRISGSIFYGIPLDDVAGQFYEIANEASSCIDPTTGEREGKDLRRISDRAAKLGDAFRASLASPAGGDRVEQVEDDTGRYPFEWGGLFPPLRGWARDIRAWSEKTDVEAGRIFSVYRDKIATDLECAIHMHARTLNQSATAEGLTSFAEAIDPIRNAVVRADEIARACGFLSCPDEVAIEPDLPEIEELALCRLGDLRALVALSALKGVTMSFQARNTAWMKIAFEGDRSDLPERMHRFGEEALELQQSLGQTREEAHTLVDYVHGRPKGTPRAEMGGTVTTLAALAHFAGLDMMACGEQELARISTPEFLAKLRTKRATRHGRGPLPGLSAPGGS